jgi:hypothetical protein
LQKINNDEPREQTCTANRWNLHAAAKLLGFDIDYKRLLTEFQSRGTLLRAFYYTTIN